MGEGDDRSNLSIYVSFRVYATDSGCTTTLQCLCGLQMDNVLIFKKGDNRSIAKISDFNLTSKLDKKGRAVNRRR